MAWLAKLDARSTRWSPPVHWGYVGLKWTLASLGAFAWIMLWYERAPVLGILQAAIVGFLLWASWRPATAPPPPGPDGPAARP